MEFPADLKSNSHTVPDISGITWTFFIQSDEGIQAQGASDLQSNLLQAESYFRLSGSHALIDLEYDGIWAFALSLGENEKLSGLARNFGLQPSGRGYVHADELVDLESPTGVSGMKRQDPTKHTKLTNADAFARNATTIPEASDAEYDNGAKSPTLSLIYAKFIQALTRSLAIALAHEPGWLLLGSNGCINERSLGFSDFHNAKTSEFVMFKCRWHVSRRLTIQVVTSQVPKLHRIADLLDSDNSFLLNKPVMVLPSAVWGLVQAVEPPFYERSKSRISRHSEAVISQCLETLGLTQAQDPRWLKIKMKESLADCHSNTNDEVDDGKLRVEILWPADQCLYHDTESFGNPFTRDGFDEAHAMDPVARAEAWFNSRTERAQALAKMEEAELAPKKLKVTKDAAARETTSALSPLDHRTNLQDASGVYPTPPDGLPTQANNTPAQEENIETIIPDAQGPATGTPYQFTDTEDHDMFEDNGMGLTEEDFEFFNEPDTEMDTTALLETPNEYGKQGGLEMPDHNKALSNSLMWPTQDTAEDLALDAQGLQTPATDEHLPGTLVSSDHEGTKIEEERQDTPAGSPQSRFSPRREDLNLAGPTGTTDFDTKYTQGGRFGFKVRYEDKEVKREAGSSAKDFEVPQVGVRDGSASDTEDTFKRGESDEATTPLSLQQPDYNSRQNPRLMLPLLDLFCSDVGVDSSVKMMFASNTTASHFAGTSQAFIQCAQIMTDQAISSMKSNAFSEDFAIVSISDQNASSSMTERGVFSKAVQTCFLTSDSLSLAEYIDLKGSYTGSSLMKVGDHHNELRKLSFPDMTVRRMGSKMDMLPSAFPFWEELSLEPLHGAKDVLAFCFSTHQEEYLDWPIATFMDMMRDAYQGCKLGRHRFIPNDEGRYADAVSNGFDALGEQLADTAPKDDTLLIYIINHHATSSAPVDLCEGALRLLEAYERRLKAHSAQSPPDLVVQLVPLSFVFDTRYVVTPSFGEYRRLALQVYDRCGPSRDAANPQPPYMAASALALSRELPAQIDFELTSDSSAAKLFEDDRLHMAYAWQPNAPWLTVSWSDNVGTLQWTAAHWLGEVSDDQWQGFRETVKEILETTLEMFEPRSRHWKIFIAKEDNYYVDEFSIWQDVVAELAVPNYKFNFFVVDSKPDLQCSVPISAIVPPANPVDQPLTPVSTPNAAANSPDLTTTAGTPGATTAFQHDPEARLVDIRDETWMFISGTGFADYYLPTPFCLAERSGFLIKRAGASDSDGIVPLAVSLISVNDESLLRETLGMYHKLATLARLRSITDTARGVLPIHVAAARRAYDAVHSSLRLGGEGG